MQLRHDWTRDEIRRIYDLPLPELIFQAQTGAPANFIPPTKCSSAACSRSRPAAAPRIAPTARKARTTRRASPARDCSIRRGAAKPPRARKRKAPRASAWARPGGRRRRAREFESVLEMVRGVSALDLEVCCTLGMLTEGAGAATEERRPYGVQPQSRYLAGILRQHHHNARLRGSPGDHRSRAQSRDHRVLRRNPGNGRIRRRPHRPAATAGQPRSAPGKRAHQHAGASRGNAARKCRGDRLVRDGAHDRGRANSDAGIEGAAGGGAAADVAGSRGALLPGGREFHFHRAKSCSPRRIPPRTTISGCSKILA